MLVVSCKSLMCLILFCSLSYSVKCIRFAQNGTDFFSLCFNVVEFFFSDCR